MKVGYLHIGREGGGVRRYGSIIGAGAGERSDVVVIEADAGERDTSSARLREAARSFAGADVVHMQWKPNDWGGGLRAVRRLRAFLASCPAPLVVTLHDVWERRGLRERWLDADAVALRWLGRRAARLVVHAEEERRRLSGLVPARRIAIVPHFVEQRVVADRESSRATLGLSGKRVITLLGFMVRRKGYRLTVDALPLLPDDVVALFAGGPMPGREARADELRARARELGVEDRMHITGYVSDDLLDAALAATDVAICPFSDLSASGSLSTWISTGRPIVVSDLPQFREYDAMVPGALRIFRPLTPEAFAHTVAATLAEGPPEQDRPVVSLRDLLLTPRTVERYLAVYRAAVAVSAVRPGAPKGSRPSPPTR
jgi:glycosyltransferase involved in cell wall biosynthesis